MTQILIVEDNLEYAEEMAEFLTELGHGVQSTNNAQEMWSALAQGTIGVVILDLGLPDEDGFDVIPRMRQLYPQIGLLVLTGRVAFDSRILGLRLGADHYLTKPIKFPELAAHIEALNRRVGPQEAIPVPSKWTLKVAARQLELQGFRTGMRWSMDIHSAGVRGSYGSGADEFWKRSQEGGLRSAVDWRDEHFGIEYPAGDAAD